jgi:formate-dependent nitrite reductase membrane component NrfD
MAFSAVCGLWWIGGVLDAGGLLEVLALPAALGAAATAGYTAYLFGQCEGRDLWQTPLLLPILLAQAVIAGGAVFAVLDVFLDVPEATAVRWALLGGVIATGGLIGVELSSRPSRNVELAVRAMTRGRYARRFWWGGVGLGLVVPALAVAVSLAAGVGSPALAAAGGLCALAGMFAYEDAFVRAGQSVPLS